MKQQQAQVLVRAEVLARMLGPTGRRARLNDRSQIPQFGRQPAAQPTIQPELARGGWYASRWSQQRLGGRWCLAPSSSSDQPCWLHPFVNSLPRSPLRTSPSHLIQDGIGASPTPTDQTRRGAACRAWLSLLRRLVGARRGGRWSPVLPHRGDDLGRADRALANAGDLLGR